MSTRSYLNLLDYRRQVADAYIPARQQAGADATAAWLQWRAARDRLFADHPQTALSLEQRSGFTGLSYFGYDPALRFAVPVVLDANPAPAAIATSTGNAIQFFRFGTVALPFGTLELYWLDQYGGGVFLPFRDATNGSHTYGGGRYLLDTCKSADLGSDADGKLILDFNFAYNPSCSYDPQWTCPLPPPANRLAVRIEGGERMSAGTGTIAGAQSDRDLRSRRRPASSQ